MVGSAPDATTSYTLTVTASTTGGTASLIISEVAPWSSGNSDASLRVDWFEVTNIGTAAANIAGWKMDDDSRNFNNAAALNGITTIALAILAVQRAGRRGYGFDSGMGIEKTLSVTSQRHQRAEG